MWSNERVVVYFTTLFIVYGVSFSAAVGYNMGPVKTFFLG